MLDLFYGVQFVVDSPLRAVPLTALHVKSYSRQRARYLGLLYCHQLQRAHARLCVIVRPHTHNKQAWDDLAGRFIITDHIATLWKPGCN